MLFFLFILLIAAVVVIIALIIAFLCDRIRRMKRARMAAKAPECLSTGAEDCAILPKAAAIISRGNRQVVAEVEECARDHTGRFESWVTKEMACWFTFRDSLISNNYAVEIDWWEEDEFIFHELDRVVEKLGFPFRRDSFVPAAGADGNEDGNGTLKTLRALSSWLRGQGYTLGSINISDCYVLFIIETDRDNEALLASAGSPSGHRITFDFNEQEKL